MHLSRDVVQARLRGVDDGHGAGGRTERQARAWCVREAWPSPATGTGLAEDLLNDEALHLDGQSDELVVLGDGLADDHLTLTWGQRLETTGSCAWASATLTGRPRIRRTLIEPATGAQRLDPCLWWPC